MKTLLWVLGAKKAFKKLPRLVQRSFGYGLYQAQMGGLPDASKILRGFGSSDLIELKEEDKGGTYRAIYTARFPGVIVALHAFQKKSKRGIKTPKRVFENLSI